MMASESMSVSVNPLRRMRLERRLTQLQLAQRSNVSMRTIVNLEQNRSARYETLCKVVAGLGLPPEQFSEVFPMVTSAMVR